MAHNIHKTKIISFTHISNNIYFNCNVSDVLILLTSCTKDLVMLDSKFHFHCHVNYLCSQAGPTHILHITSYLWIVLIVLWDALVNVVPTVLACYSSSERTVGK